MRTRAHGHIGVGAFSTTLGALALVGGLVRPPFLAGDLAGTPFWALALAGGGAMALVGSITLFLSLRRVEEPEPEVLAHVAFSSRMQIPSATPTPSPAPRAAPAAYVSPARAAAAAPASMPAPAQRLPAPAPVQQRRLPPPRADIAGLATEIAELTRKINKAGVMLATGQLSQQGYLAYVEDLKRQRATLEAQRARAEIS